MTFRDPVRAAAAVAVAASEERFRVRSAVVIESLLRTLIARAEPVLLHYGGTDPLATRFLGLDALAGTLACDWGASPRAMRALLDAPRLVVSTQLEQVRIRFDAGPAEPGDWQDLPAFRIAVPAALTRMQRRGAYRLRLPGGRPHWCRIQGPGLPEGLHMVRLHDISLSGVGLTDLPATWNPTPGSVYRDCSIALADCGTLRLDIEIVHTRANPTRRAGCRFVNLPPEQAGVIQRYITRASAPSAGHLAASLAAVPARPAST